jgi:hypothetical protein
MHVQSWFRFTQVYLLNNICNLLLRDTLSESVKKPQYSSYEYDNIQSLGYSQFRHLIPIRRASGVLRVRGSNSYGRQVKPVITERQFYFMDKFNKVAALPFLHMGQLIYLPFSIEL